jgi:restriction endonuclease S subunit
MNRMVVANSRKPVERVMRFKLPEPKFAPFLFLCLQRQEFVSHLSNGLTGSDLPHVTGTTVAEYTFGFPPPAEQVVIVRRVEALFKLADAIEKRVAAVTTRTEELTQAILAKAFRGELVPTEAELARREGRSYESASALLDRIPVLQGKKQRQPKNCE